MKPRRVILRVPSNPVLKNSAKVALHHATRDPRKTVAAVALPGRKLDIDSMPSFRGLELDHSFAAVPQQVFQAHKHRDVSTLVEESEHFFIRGFLHPDQIQKYPHRVGDADLFAELAIEMWGNCPLNTTPVGDVERVRERLGIARLRAMNLTGEGVAIALFDTGINLKALTQHLKRLHLVPKFAADAAWHPHDNPRKPGTWDEGHGTMCAYDALIAAPEATLVDFPILEVKTRDTNGDLGPQISNAISAFSVLMCSRAHGLLKEYRAVVASNSWGLMNPPKGQEEGHDFPEGHPGRCGNNPDHPFNRQIVAATTAMNIDVLFSAGNCGEECPDKRCSRNLAGSITGANAVREALTVGGCDIDNNRLGYSSQGPSSMGTPKPDLVAYTHFLGSTVDGPGTPDTGTSAACPVAAGCVAALRSSPKAGSDLLPTATLFETLRTTAIRPDGVTQGAWNRNVGWGIISPIAAAAKLNLHSEARQRGSIPA